MEQWTSRLLAEDEPAPYEIVQGGVVGGSIVEGREGSPFVIVCDHAGRRIPRSLAGLGLSEADLERHIAWDLGVAELGRCLAGELGAWLILANYSRLVIDCNRPLGRADSIARVSEDTVIVGNQSVDAAEASLRAREIFEPYHTRIQSELDDRAARGEESVLVFLHSFTPVFRGVRRALHAGVLHLEDERLARPMLDALRREPGLLVGDNEPYAASTLTDYGIVVHGLGRGLRHVELEVRQDLLASEEGRKEWALRLARLLRESAAFPT